MDRGSGEKTWMKKTREGKRGRESLHTCGDKSIAIMYTNNSALNTKRHCVAGKNNVITAAL